MVVGVSGHQEVEINFQLQVRDTRPVRDHRDSPMVLDQAAVSLTTDHLDLLNNFHVLVVRDSPDWSTFSSCRLDFAINFDVFCGIKVDA